MSIGGVAVEGGVVRIGSPAIAIGVGDIVPGAVERGLGAMVDVNEESGLLGGGGEGEDEGGEEAERYAAGHEEQGTTCGVQGSDPTSGNRGQMWGTRRT
jgi:hypothetical protein